jgi:plasmid stabilization system protein ParE
VEIRFTFAAERDLAAIHAWYETQRQGLGSRFLGAFESLLARLAESPMQFPELMEGMRRALLRRFPYGVYFTLDQSTIVVRAVLHLHRDPDAWRSRPQRGQ